MKLLPFCVAFWFVWVEICAEDGADTIRALNERFDRVIQEFSQKIVALEERVRSLESAEEYRQATRKVLRSCAEIKLFDPWKPSGVYEIDPDGPASGDEPVLAYCDMVTGSTLITHDTHGPTRVDDCHGRGCFHKSVTYHAPMRQLIALTSHSAECRQTFEWTFDCKDLDMSLVESSWWQDRHNVPRPFINCTRNSKADGFTCSASSTLDHNRAQLLPVSAVYLGRQPSHSKSRSQEKSVKSNFTLGKLECSGWVQGPKGLDGVPGTPGFNGLPGVPGLTGQTGPRGPEGPVGPTGPQGPKGSRGETGPKGSRGVPGVAGPVGPMGPKGDVGAPGEAGPRGDAGVPGAPGIQGWPGAMGPRGNRGPKGDSAVAVAAAATGTEEVQHVDGCPKDLGDDTSCHEASTGCYCLVQSKRTWKDSAQFCQSRNMELVSIETADEQEVLSQLLDQGRVGAGKHWWWTSGSDEGHEGEWIWTATGEAYNFTNWDKWQPNGGADSNYMLMVSSYYRFKWYDVKMSDPAFAICEV